MYPAALTGLEPWSLNSSSQFLPPQISPEKNGAVGRVGNTMVIMKINMV